MSNISWTMWKERAEAAERERDELKRANATLEVKVREQSAEIERLRNELRIEAHQAAAMQQEINRMEWAPATQAFERMAPLDWRSDYNTETPLGQQLDGIGDEVEG